MSSTKPRTKYINLNGRTVFQGREEVLLRYVNRSLRRDSSSFVQNITTSTLNKNVGDLRSLFYQANTDGSEIDGLTLIYFRILSDGGEDFRTREEEFSLDILWSVILSNKSIRDHK
jgi:hypothetical protein